ncbi:MAG: hypothetical protein ACYDAD_12480 [Acidimicrobiales bacterium]
MTDSPERSDALDRALDLVLFAPLGLALSARELLPELAEKGRQQVEGQLTMARVVGEFAIRESRNQAERLVRRWQEQAEATLQEFGLAGGPGPAPELAAGSTDGPGPAPERAVGPAGPAPSSNGTAGTPAAVATPRPPSPPLAIPGYDTLSASQVVSRLPGLSRSELEAVRAYEQASRARKTVLARIAQLQLAS